MASLQSVLTASDLGLCDMGMIIKQALQCRVLQTPSPHLDLRGLDLSGADLSGADLSGADLREANLSGADLTGADLTGADLTGVDLTEVDLKGAHLSDDLKGWVEFHSLYFDPYFPGMMRCFYDVRNRVFGVTCYDDHAKAIVAYLMQEGCGQTIPNETVVTITVDQLTQMTAYLSRNRVLECERFNTLLAPLLGEESVTPVPINQGLSGSLLPFDHYQINLAGCLPEDQPHVAGWLSQVSDPAIIWQDHQTIVSAQQLRQLMPWIDYFMVIKQQLNHPKGSNEPSLIGLWRHLNLHPVPPDDAALIPALIARFYRTFGIEVTGHESITDIQRVMGDRIANNMSLPPVGPVQGEINPTYLTYLKTAVTGIWDTIPGERDAAWHQRQATIEAVSGHSLSDTSKAQRLVDVFVLGACCTIANRLRVSPSLSYDVLQKMDLICSLIDTRCSSDNPDMTSLLTSIRAIGGPSFNAHCQSMVVLMHLNAPPRFRESTLIPDCSTSQWDDQISRLNTMVQSASADPFIEAIDREWYRHGGPDDSRMTGVYEMMHRMVSTLESMQTGNPTRYEEVIGKLTAQLVGLDTDQHCITGLVGRVQTLYTMVMGDAGLSDRIAQSLSNWLQTTCDATRITGGRAESSMLVPAITHFLVHKGWASPQNLVQIEYPDHFKSFIVEIERVWDASPRAIKKVILDSMVVHYEAEIHDMLAQNPSGVDMIVELFQRIDPAIERSRIHACMNEYDGYQFNPMALGILLRLGIDKAARAGGWLL